MPYTTLNFVNNLTAETRNPILDLASNSKYAHTIKPYMTCKVSGEFSNEQTFNTHTKLHTRSLVDV